MNDSIAPGSGPDSASVDDAPELTVVDIANGLLRQRRLILTIPVLLALLVGVVTLIQPRTYTAVASFLPYGGEATQARAAGLAAQFGFSLPSSSAGESPDFYAELLRGRQVLAGVAESQYEIIRSPRVPFWGDPTPVRGTLTQILEIEEPTPEQSRERTVEKLRELVSVSTAPLSGTVTIRVGTEWPELSWQVADRMLELVNEFNRTRRQSQAAAERRFIEERLESQRNELRNAEGDLKLFLERNRMFERSPDLAFEHDRLQREVAMRQQVYTSLAQAYEQARIDEVRNTPVITVVQAPDTPALPDRRRLPLKVVAALAVGGILGVAVGVAREIFTSTVDADRNGSEELRVLKRELWADLRRPWRLVLPFHGKSNSAGMGGPTEGVPRSATTDVSSS